MLTYILKHMYLIIILTIIIIKCCLLLHLKLIYFKCTTLQIHHYKYVMITNFFPKIDSTK